MGDIGRVAAYVALLGTVAGLFVGLAVLLLAQSLSGAAMANPLGAMTSVLKTAAVGGGLGLAYGLVAGGVVAVARRLPLPGRRVVAAAVVFAIGVSAIGERALAVAFGEAALPRVGDVLPALLVRAIAAAVVALISWQEVGQREYRIVATLGQAGRAQRRS